MGGGGNVKNDIEWIYVIEELKVPFISDKLRKEIIDVVISSSRIDLSNLLELVRDDETATTQTNVIINVNSIFMQDEHTIIL